MTCVAAVVQLSCLVIVLCRTGAVPDASNVDSDSNNKNDDDDDNDEKDENNDNDNYGTALYGPSDVAKHRWTDRERTELQCRMLVGPLVPTKTPEDGRVFLDYFDLIKNSAEKIDPTAGWKRRRALVMAVDAVGGYLYARMLPRARMLYYEGRLNYSTAKRLHDLMKNIKYVLDTDGRGWARPAAAEEHHAAGDKATATAVAALVVSRIGGLPTAEADAPRCGGVDAGPYALRPRRRPRRRRRRRHDEDATSAADALPFFDNDTRPHSLIVPWRPARPVLYGVRDAACHRALFDHCAAAAAAAATVRSPPDGHATATDRHARDLSAWLHAVARPLVTPEAAARRWCPGLWAVRPVARLLRLEAGPPTDARGPPPAAPNVNFYATAVLASAATAWTAGACVLFRGRWLRCLCLACGRALCVRRRPA